MNISYTSTLPVSLAQWIENVSKKRKVTKKEIIVRALRHYQEKTKKEELQETFQRVRQDKSILAMAEEGLDDTLLQMQKL